MHFCFKRQEEQMDNRKIIQILLIALVLCGLVLILLIYLNYKRINEKNKDSIFMENKNVKTRWLYAAYKFFSNFFLTRYYISKIKKKFEIIYPNDIRKVGELTALTAIKIWIISLILILIACFNFSPYMILATVSLIYLINSTFIFRSVETQEINLMMQLDKFLSSIRHFYYQTGGIETAIEESLTETEEPMLYHAETILGIIHDSNMDEKRNLYHEIVPNRFLRTFLALCSLIVKFGDRTINGQSLLLSNLTDLKNEIAIELRKRQKINHKFSGLGIVAVAPMYTLELIKGWAISNLPELQPYYNGMYGIITVVIIFIGSLMIYNVLNIMREANQADVKEHVLLESFSDIKWVHISLTTYMNRNYGKTMKLNDLIKRVGESITVKQFLLKSIFYSVVAFVFGILLMFIIHGVNKQNITNYTNNITFLDSSVSKKEIESTKKFIVSNTMKYKKRKLTKEIREEIENDFIAAGVLRNKELMTMTLEEVYHRITKYQKEYFKWYELVVVLFISILTFQFPYYLLLFRKRVMQMNMEDEVIQFQSIILMLMHIERISVHDILSWLEGFAVIFKKSIGECLNDMPTGEQKALKNLRNKEPFEPFQQVVDNLLMCDRIGTKKAFDEVAIERRNFQLKRDQENNIEIDKKSAIGEKIAFAPFTATVALYLIVPFVVESLSQLISMLPELRM